MSYALNAMLAVRSLRFTGLGAARLEQREQRRLRDRHDDGTAALPVSVALGGRRGAPRDTTSATGTLVKNYMYASNISVCSTA